MVPGKSADFVMKLPPAISSVGWWIVSASFGSARELISLLVYKSEMEEGNVHSSSSLLMFCNEARYQFTGAAKPPFSGE